MRPESSTQIGVVRVLHVASGDLWAGAEVALFHLVRALAANPGVVVGVVLLNEGELAVRLRGLGIDVQVLDERQYGLIRLLVQLNARVWLFRPHIIHTHRSKEHLLGALVSRLRPGITSLRTVHGGAENPAGRRPGLRDLVRHHLDRSIVRLQCCVVAVSGPLAAELKTAWPDKRVLAIANGIDCAAIRAAASGATDLVIPGRVNVCFSGRLVPVKRVEVFLAAARLVCDAYPGRYRFYVLGDGPLRAPLEDQAEQLHLGSDCVFAGFLSEALPILRRMAALVLTSDHEGTPMVALEALALGVPVVAHAVGGLVPLLESVAQAQLVCTQDPAEIASAILIAAPPDWQLSADRANLLPAEYRIEACAAAHLALYRDLLDQPSA